MSYSNHFVSLVAHFFSLSLSLSRITRVNIGRVCIQGASAYRVSLHVTLESVFAAITLAKCWITDAIHFSKGNLFSPFRNSFFFFFLLKGSALAGWISHATPVILVITSRCPFLSQQLPRPLSYHYSSSPFNHQECFSVPLFSFLPVVQHSIVVEAICSCRFFTVRPIGGG